MRFSPFRNFVIALLIPLSAAAMLLQSPFAEHPAISYSKETPTDPVSRLAQRLSRGEEQLEFDLKQGYLPSLLKKLNVPVSSQALVFSKTSLQIEQILPRRPRALYFNDDIYVGWIPNAPLIEFASVDPKLGTVFYTLDQESAPPRLERRTTDCVSCHDGSSTGGVPGLIMRSVYPDRDGNAILRANNFLTTDRSPWQERWGGWYVTGTHGDPVHMGNLMAAHHVIAIGRNAQAYVAQMDLNAGANLKDVRNKFDSAYYLSPHSDVVALLVLTHQTNVHNLITRMNYEARIAIFEQKISEEARDLSPAQIPIGLRNTAETLVSAMLFTGEPQLAGPVIGTSGFAEQFALSGPRDRKGRSLRDLDLNRRLFRYPLSYLIYSEAFDALPDPAKVLIYLRLREILSGNDTGQQFAHLSQEDRTAILQILDETKRGF
jgi:hypothetical protein